MFDFLKVDSDITVWLVLDGEEYELSQFKISFGQAVDHKGQPQNEVRGGCILLTLDQSLPENIYRWAMTSSMKNGEVVFRSKTANPPLRVEFKNAYCINLDRLIDIHTGLNTALTISPGEIDINGINLDNHWV